MKNLIFLVVACCCMHAGVAQTSGSSNARQQPNAAFKNAVTININDATAYRGKVVKICDRVSEVKLPDIAKNRASELYVGGHFPDQKFTIVIPRAVRERFSYNPEEKMVNKRFCIVGKITRHKGKPAIVVRNENQINEEE